MKPIHRTILLIMFVLLGTTLRTINLSSNPPGFFADEAVIGLDAYSLMHHGTDHASNPPRFLFQGLGYPLGFVPIVSTVPTAAIFGLTEFATRLPSSLYGAASILLTFAIATELFGPNVGLLASLFLAISPWHIHLSRTGLEVSGYLFWMLLAIWLFLRSLNQKKLFPLAAVSFGIAIYTYSPARILSPLFLALLVMIFWKTLLRQKNLLISLTSLLIFFLLTLPFTYTLVRSNGLQRLSAVSVANLHLSLQNEAAHVARAYFNHFSVAFLFTKGDIDFPGQFITRHSIRGIGLSYLLQLPFILVGFWNILSAWRKKESQLILAWLLVYPVAGSITENLNPYATRGILGVVPFQILTGLGLIAVFRWIGKRWEPLLWPLFTATAVAFVFSFLFFIQKWQQYPLYAADFWGWQFGPRQIMTYFLAHKDNFDELYIAGNFNAPEIFLRFYDPQNSCQNKCMIGDAKRINDKKKQLFAIGTDRLKDFSLQQFRLLDTIYYPNGQAAFDIGWFAPKVLAGL